MKGSPWRLPLRYVRAGLPGAARRRPRGRGLLPRLLARAREARGTPSPRRTACTRWCSRCSWSPSRCRSTPSSASACRSFWPATAFPGAWLLDALIDIPLAVSPVIIGLSLILVYGHTGWWGNWLAARGITVIFSVPGIIMASAAVSLPYVVREVLPVLQEIGTEQEQAARTLGAGRSRSSAASRCPASAGASPTASRSPRPACWASSAPSPSCRAPSPARPRPTLFSSRESIDNLQPQAAYVGAVVLCLAALIVLSLLTLTDRNRDAWHGKAAA